MKLSIGLGGGAAALALACVVGLAIGVQAPRRADDTDFGRKVRTYILNHPEIVAEAAVRLRIEPVRQAITAPFASAWAGNPKGDVTLVIFSDYNCPYCRATTPEIDHLVAHDPNVRIVWREMPVLGPESEAAAAAALAAAKRGRYPAFHHALFSGSHPDGAGIAAAAKSAALDPHDLSKDANAPDVQAEIRNNLMLARRLQISATPFFVIGNRIYEGAIGADMLAEAVAEARKDRD